ncbi:MAG: Smr/MutS family protein [Marivibrio sp.]|uniref:Smr/MutS family protein n=1 Tax=Marivibrio sp. TaxID=2039719 RepID=UPI0032EE7562
MARGGPPKKDEEGRSLWAAVTSTVRPLGDRPMQARGLDRSERDRRDAPSHPLSDTDAAKAAMRRRIARVAAHNAETAKATLAPAPPDLAPGRTPGLDRRSAERLRRGKLPIDGRLDLHGMSREAAHAAVEAFVLRAHATGKRCVIVVTGKGRGILKESAPHWLNLPPLRDKIIAIETCRPEHGGDGALYVLLRRQRDRGP